MTIISGIIMLGILVFVHELGHYCVARLAGVKILKFSLGFGPKIISKTWGETEYLVCAIPLGGYVQMLGEGGGELGEDAELLPAERERSFADKSVMRRLAIVAAGPMMNLILPFLILPVTYMVGTQIPAYIDQPACVGYVTPGSEAAQAGFLAGDCLQSLNDDQVLTWSDANKELVNFAGEALRFGVVRQGKPMAVVIPAENGSLEGLQSIGILPLQPAVIGSLMPGMPAAAAGLHRGDLILQIAGQKIFSWYDLKRIIQQTEGKEVLLLIERGGQELRMPLQPKLHDSGAWLIGIGPEQQTVNKKFGPLAAIREGAGRTIELIDLTLVFVQKLFTGHVSAKNIGGPITVVQIAGQAAQTDMSAVLSVLAFISIQLGILNLLPIPILDGGHIFFYVFELVFRKPISVRAREILQQIGLALLIMLMILAFYNDLARIFWSS
ncbi:RIP metalloprotease RseP [Geopsychrobacter electrodiphilus]|uniref:RIP metalloprotease RseP n=1 Tax=Geopsychrobacter electrodiphilus TaxID=225196 RepID=UPI000374986E|nr:RIP metalloprotease RseP [Geopsychrobacter electrodiphilus]